jgi:hypothetical protein
VVVGVDFNDVNVLEVVVCDRSSCSWSLWWMCRCGVVTCAYVSYVTLLYAFVFRYLLWLFRVFSESVVVADAILLWMSYGFHSSVVVVFSIRASCSSNVLCIAVVFIFRHNSIFMILISSIASGRCECCTSTSLVPKTGWYTWSKIGVSSPEMNAVCM